MLFTKLTIALMSVAPALAAWGDSCWNLNTRVTGVCTDYGDCGAYGGRMHDGLCPNDGPGIKCCTYGNCADISLCIGGSYTRGKCPGGERNVWCNNGYNRNV